MTLADVELRPHEMIVTVILRGGARLRAVVASEWGRALLRTSGAKAERMLRSAGMIKSSEEFSGLLEGLETAHEEVTR